MLGHAVNAAHAASGLIHTSQQQQPLLHVPLDEARLQGPWSQPQRLWSQTCDDDPGFIDARNYSCSGWADFDCSQAVSTFGYDSSDMQALLDACPDTCDRCDRDECLPPSGYIFWHLMKTGGLSVDQLLNCACTHEHCSVKHDDGSDDLYGDRGCDEHPTVLTTHGNPFAYDRSGGYGTNNWANASNITILRDPVSRIWSYYAYAREHHYEPFLQHPLAYYLEQPEVNFELLNDTPQDHEANEGAFVLHQSQLFNRMTRTFGSRNFECGGPSFGEPICGKPPPEGQSSNWTLEFQQSIEQRWLSNAIETIRGLDYIGFTESFGNLRADLAEVWPALLPPDSPCQLNRENPTDYPGVGLESTPDEYTRLLIEKRNALDMQLFQEAIKISEEKKRARARRRAVLEVARQYRS